MPNPQIVAAMIAAGASLAISVFQFVTHRRVTRGQSPRFGSNVVIGDAPLDVLPIHAHGGAIEAVTKLAGRTSGQKGRQTGRSPQSVTCQ
jgi:hypothetical protein